MFSWLVRPLVFACDLARVTVFIARILIVEGILGRKISLEG
jgi:hypothetical protein